MAKDIKHFGVLGMRWGHRKTMTPTQKDQRFFKTLGKGLGVGAVTPVARGVKGLNKIEDAVNKMRKPKTDPIYDKDGNDISANPYKRLFKPKGQSDKDFDAEIEAEMNPPKEKLIGKPVKTLFGIRTEAVYDANGKDISSKPFGRPFKKKGQSDKDFDDEFNREDTPEEIAKKKVFDIQMEKNYKVQLAVALGTSAAMTVGMYFAKKSLGEAAKKSIIAKYGPELAKKIIEMKGL